MPTPPLTPNPRRPQDIVRDGLRARAARIALARVDINTFAEVVLRDEATGAEIIQAPLHQAWHQLADSHPNVVIWSAVEHGKTVQMSICRVLFALGRNPNIRVAILSNTKGQAEKIVRTLRQYIENSDALHQVFPDLVPSPREDDPWHLSQLTVKRPHIAKDPSVQAVGVHNSILGSRLDLVVIDDVLDWENTRTSRGREDLYQWIQATLVGRLTQDSRVVVIGTAFHREDYLHKLSKEPGWVARRYPAVDAHGTPAWPAVWPVERLQKRRQMFVGSPLEWARQMLCIARDDATARFQWAWIEQGLTRGEGRSLAAGLARIPPGCAAYTGVDLAVQQHSAADEVVLFSILVHPNEDREVLDITAGRWTGPDILTQIRMVHLRFQSICIVENNAAQDFILQFSRATSAVPVRPFTTGRNKAHPEFGVEGIAAELAQGKWIIPNPGPGRAHPEVARWIQEMLDYQPGQHTGDRLMASWFAREGIRMGQIVAETGRLNTLSR